MLYSVFERIMSKPRMSRYLTACSNDTRKAMTLYRLNLKLSQELFTLISCFEIAIRNAVNNHYTYNYGNDWLRDSVSIGGIFDKNKCRKTRKIIRRGLRKLNQNYTHYKLIAEMDFGFWKYLFAQPQFYAGGQSLLKIFPAKPRSGLVIQYNNKYVFNELEKINEIRNRIAHHEPICFRPKIAIVETAYVKQNYELVKDLFGWMQIDESALLYGIDHVNQTIVKIDDLGTSTIIK